MTDVPEIAQWLTRFEKKFGVEETRGSLQKLSDARELFFEELGYNITRKQFEHLNEAKNEKVQEEIRSHVIASKGRKYIKNDREYHQIIYKNETTGQFSPAPGQVSKSGHHGISKRTGKKY